MNTETLRPIHNHASYQWDQHDWNSVNDGDDGTYLRMSIPDAVIRLYKMSAPSFYGAISSVKVYVRAKCVTADECHIKPALLTHGTIYYGTDTTLEIPYADYYYSWSTNPSTGKAWTVQEVADLYAGFWAYDGTIHYVYTADVWVGTTYTASPITPLDQTIRPSSNNTVALTPSTGSNYACVDEATANDETDDVTPGVEDTWQTDLYNMGSLPTPVGEVLWVRIVNAVMGYNGSFRTVLRTHSTTYNRPSEGSVLPSYVKFETVYGFNPYTGENWTPSEISDLIAGTALYSTSSGAPRCTQVYVEVYGLPKTGGGRAQIIGMW